MKIIKKNNEVYYCNGGLVFFDKKIKEFLVSKAKENFSGKCRICFHKDLKSPLHEMIIIHSKKSYVPPHRHLKNSESLTILQGSADLIIFDRRGNIVKKVLLTDQKNGVNFYRMNKSTFHSLIIKSKYLIFHEITRGPFVKKNMIVAKWENSFKKKYFK